MNDVNVNFDIAGLAHYFEDRVLRLVGRDSENRNWNEKFKRRWLSAFEQATNVQCVGMDRPIPIERIYQPVPLYRAQPGWQKSTALASPVTLATLLARNTDATVLAGPGRGKSMLLNAFFINLIKDDRTSPILFMLRSDEACADLTEFVRKLAAGRRPDMVSKRPVVLLVDGYDEVDETQRKQVSAALNEFKNSGYGRFYLTCRTFYDIYDLKVPSYRVGNFRDEDAVKFVQAFSTNYERHIDATALIEELRTRRLIEFARHPLLLTLTCILKTGARPDLPQNALALLKRAFDTLTFRWDEQKGVARQSALPLDGEDRISCTMFIAHHMAGLQATSQHVEAIARNFLSITHAPKLDPRKLVLEIARWYGVLVQVDQDKWQFAHRCIHDYLAARHLVESGKFVPQKVKVWDARAAYAACLSPNATEAITIALERSADLHTFTECLYNRTRFDTKSVADAVIRHFCKYRRDLLVHRQGYRIAVQTEKDFFRLASPALLYDLVDQALRNRPMPRDSSEAAISDPHDVVCIYAMAFLRLSQKTIPNPNTLQNALQAYTYGETVFEIIGDPSYEFSLRQAFSPQLQSRIR